VRRLARRQHRVSHLRCIGDWGSAGLVLDESSNTCVTANTANVSEASADRFVTSVGGTEFTPVYSTQGNDVGHVPEDVWNDSGGASGGGMSQVFSKPSYQTPSPRTIVCAMFLTWALGASAVSPGFFWVDASGEQPELDAVRRNQPRNSSVGGYLEN